jgi:hypothetical protein
MPFDAVQQGLVNVAWMAPEAEFPADSARGSTLQRI